MPERRNLPALRPTVDIHVQNHPATIGRESLEADRLPPAIKIRPVLPLSRQPFRDPDDHRQVAPDVHAGSPQLGIGHVRVELANVIQIVFVIFDHAGEGTPMQMFWQVIHRPKKNMALQPSLPSFTKHGTLLR